MRNQTIALYALLLCAACTFGGAAHAQQWPTRPVRIIVPFPPGQAADIITRIIAERLSPALGQQVIVDNRPGAGAALGTEIGAKSAPDGYTFVAGGSAALAINPHLYKKLGYDTPRDFAPVTQLVAIAMVFVVNPNLAARNLPELIHRELLRSGGNELRLHAGLARTHRASAMRSLEQRGLRHDRARLR